MYCVNFAHAVVYNAFFVSQFFASFSDAAQHLSPYAARHRALRCATMLIQPIRPRTRLRLLDG